MGAAAACTAAVTIGYTDLHGKITDDMTSGTFSSKTVHPRDVCRIQSTAIDLSPRYTVYKVNKALQDALAIAGVKSNIILSPLTVTPDEIDALMKYHKKACYDKHGWPLGGVALEAVKEFGGYVGRKTIDVGIALAIREGIALLIQYGPALILLVENDTDGQPIIKITQDTSQPTKTNLDVTPYV